MHAFIRPSSCALVASCLLGATSLGAMSSGCAETAPPCAEGMFRSAITGECTPLPDGGAGRMDGGPDAGASDAGASDAGRDAGTDTDAGPCSMGCAGETPVCDEASGRCVECLPDQAGACGGATSVCHPTEHRCVECTAESTLACVDPTPRCDDEAGACVECTDNEHCADPTPLCDRERGECVACSTYEHCTLAAPACVDGECAGCTEDPQCAGRTATPVCDEPSGLCVQCTVDSEETSCPGPDELACHPEELTCTGEPRGSLGFCEPCVSDSECATTGLGELRCVPTTYKGSLQGTYCLLSLQSHRDTTSNPAALCPNGMSEALEETSVGGETDRYCFINQAATTCDAVTDFDTLCTDSAECGDPDLTEDGHCPSGGGRCTYPCTGDSQCESGECPGEFSDRYCR